MSLLRSIAMMLIPLTVITAVHFYLYRRLFSRPGWNRRWSLFGRWSLFVLGASIPSSMLVLHFAPRSVGSLVAWPAMTWLGVLFFLLLILLPSELVVLVNWLYARGTGAHSPARRRMLARAVATVAGIGAVGASAVSIFGALRELAVKRVRVPLAKLPGALEGLRVVQVSDIHVGPTIGEGFVRTMVEKVNALTPDVIAITGDLVDGSVETLAEHVAPLADLRARYGVFFVTGNHEYIGDAEEWVEFFVPSAFACSRMNMKW